MSNVSSGGIAEKRNGATGAVNSANAAESKRDARKGAIVQAAADLYAELGVRKTSIAKVMDRAGLTRELFYYYFRDKDELSAEVVESYMLDVRHLIDDMIARARQDIDENTEYVEQMRMIVHGMHALFSTRDGYRLDRVAVIRELDVHDMYTRRVTDYLIAAVCETEEYKRFISEYGDVSKRHFELVLYGIVGLVYTRTDLDDTKVAEVVMSALRRADASSQAS